MLMIREFTGSDADFEQMLAIKNRVYPFQQDSVARWQHMWRCRADDVIFGWYMAACDGASVATGGYQRARVTDGVNRFYMTLEVDPAYQGRGFGRNLYHRILADLRPHAPQQIVTRTRQDLTRSMRFAIARGFEPQQWEYEQVLDPRPFDATPFAGLQHKLALQGIEIRSLRQLGTDPDRDRKLYELAMQIHADIPAIAPFVPPPFDAWRQRVMTNPTLLPDGYLVAVHANEFIGLTQLNEGLGNRWEIYQGITGVRRDYRRRGIGLALKVRAIEYAQRHHKAQIKTFNARDNSGMLRINEIVGFKRQPAWVTLVKRMKEEG